MGEHIEVRATINLPGLSAGVRALVDPDVPYIADALREMFLVPTAPIRLAEREEPPAEAPDPEPETEPETRDTSSWSP